jgi:hypothetical protein
MLVVIPCLCRAVYNARRKWHVITLSLGGKVQILNTLRSENIILDLKNETGSLTVVVTQIDIILTNDSGSYWLLLLGGIVQSVPCTAAIYWSIVLPI